VPKQILKVPEACAISVGVRCEAMFEVVEALAWNPSSGAHGVECLEYVILSQRLADTVCEQDRDLAN
jgi:hypothetical protein